MALSYYVNNFVHTLWDDKTEKPLLDIFQGVACVEDSTGKIKFISRIDDSLWGAVKGLDLEADDAEEAVIKALGRTAKDTTVVIARKGQFFFPGFIDTHIHACQYPNSGLFGQKALLDWLQEYTYPTEQRLSDPSVAKRVYNRCISRTLSNGTTTAAYYATIDRDSTNILAQTCFEAGQRAFVGRCNMDVKEKVPLVPPYNDESTKIALRDTELCIEYITKMDPAYNLVRPVLTPRFALNCSHELLDGLGRRAEQGLMKKVGPGNYKKTNLPCQTHIAENKNEYKDVMRIFGEIHDDLDGYAHVYEKYGLLREDMILAHAVHLSDDDIARIVNRKAKVSHCPISNVALLSGNAKVRDMLEAGITVGLGTDHAGGYSPSMLEVVRDTTMVSRIVAVEEESEGGEKPEEHKAKLSVTEALYLATGGGAKVMGMEGKVGCFVKGMEWDASLVGVAIVPERVEVSTLEKEVKVSTVGGSMGPVDVFGWESQQDVVEKWVYSGDDRNFLKVWVQGKLVHQKPAGGCTQCR